MEDKITKRKKAPPKPGGAFFLCLPISVFALLICNAARGLAGRLAGSLAFAAAAVLGTLAKIAGLNGVDVLHIANPPNFMSLTVIIARPQRTVNELTEENSPKR